MRAVKVGLMPPLCEDQYAQQAKDPAKLVHYYYNLLGGRYKIKQGQAKTHEILIAFDERPKLDAFQQDVMATAPSAWVCGSLALGEIAPTGTAWSTPYDAQMDKCVVNNIKAGDARRDYGMMNYGDWWGERGFNWGNIEYDDAHVWMVQFARTGDTRSFMLGDRAAKHYGDVDCIHYCADLRGWAPAARTAWDTWAASLRRCRSTAACSTRSAAPATPALKGWSSTTC